MSNEITIRAYFCSGSEKGAADFFRASIHVDAETFAAIPKSLRFKTANWSQGISLAPNKATGDKNESGIKRIRAILKAFPDATFKVDALNSYQTLEEFKQVHGI